MLTYGIVHRPDGTLIPTLSTRGRAACKVFAYGHQAGILDQAAELAAEHGVAGARLVRPLGPEATPADGVRIQLKDFTGRPCEDPGGPVQEFTEWPAAVRDTFDAYARAMAADGLASSTPRCKREVADRSSPPSSRAASSEPSAPWRSAPTRSATGSSCRSTSPFCPRPVAGGLGRLLWRAAMHWGQCHGADYQLLQTEVGGASDRLCRAEGLASLGFVRTRKV
ncbi:GNAT family N-acetyltransferase [Streptomyces anandii]|uniref:GNAT family N-acetyltransferase n=1 Tax=Streptomyces anandii TaxID=285454 RepID=A0ABW6HD06_9ACTN